MKIYQAEVVEKKEDIKVIRPNITFRGRDKGEKEEDYEQAAAEFAHEREYVSTVSEVITRSVTFAEVGFRIYCTGNETSSKKDEIEDKFFEGYGMKSDKHVPLYDASIR